VNSIGELNTRITQYRELEVHRRCQYKMPIQA